MKLQTLSAMSLVFALALGGAACKKKPEAGAAGSSVDSMATMKAVNDFMKNNGGEPQSISCPPGVAVKAGATFDCIGKMKDGRDLTVTATMTDAAGALSFKVTKLDPAAGGSAAGGSADSGSGSAAAPAGSDAGSGSAAAPAGSAAEGSAR